MHDVTVSIDTETEAERGWEFRARLRRNGRLSTHVLRLAWADHDHWSGGATPPSRVAAAVLRVVGQRLGAEDTPSRFDASTLRRVIPDLDALVRAEIDRSD